MAYLTDSAPEEALAVPWMATFGLSGAGAGVLVGDGAGVGVEAGTVAGVAVCVAFGVTGSDSVERSDPDRAAQEVESVSISSRPASETACFMGGSFDGTGWPCRLRDGLDEVRSKCQ